MFREFREVSEEKNIDGVERFKDEYVVDIEEVMNILKSLGKQDVVSELASQDLSQFDRKFVKKEFKDGKYALFQKNKEGERHGQYFQFYPSGQLDRIATYQNGLKEGASKKYTEEGYLEAETAYHKGLINGIFTRYHTDGKTPSQIVEEYNGVVRKSTYYRRDGSKLSEMNFEDGKPVGLRRIFKKDGKTVAKEVSYSGTLKSFGLNGKKISEVKYIDGVPEHETKGKVTSLFKELSKQKPQPPRTPNTSQEYSYDLNFNSSRDVHSGQNGAMKIDFSMPAPKPNVPSGQTTDMQQTVQSNGQKPPISYMKKQFFNKGGSR